MSQKDRGLPSYTSSPGIMSPISPANLDSPARSSDVSSLAPRLRTLELQSQLAATEIALLRQLGDDLGSWRYRVDSASTQTAHVLQHLNKELDDLKIKVQQLTTGEVATNQGAVDELVTQMKSCYKDLQGALGRLQEGPTSSRPSSARSVMSVEDGIQARLRDVEIQLASTQTIMRDFDNGTKDVKTELAGIKASVLEAGAAADSAAVDAAAAVNTANAVATETNSLYAQVQALSLGLEVVEQSLEDLDVTDALSTLRSRVDDLDAGIEHAADEALAQISDIQTAIKDLRQEVTNAEEAAAAAAERAARAEAAAAFATEDVAALRRDIRHRNAVPMTPPSPVSSTAGSPSVSTGSDPRLKAAVHTLSDGYRSLHRAMSLMYEEQSEVTNRVNAVGSAAMASSTKLTTRSPASRIKALNGNSNDGAVVLSHPVALNSSTTVEVNIHKKKSKTAEEAAVESARDITELRALVRAQAQDAIQQQRRADALEAELTEMKRLLCALAPVTVPKMPVSAHGGTAAVIQDPLTPEAESLVDSALPLPKEESNEVPVAVNMECDEKKGSVKLSLSQQKCRITLGAAAGAMGTKNGDGRSSASSVHSQGIAAKWDH